MSGSAPPIDQRTASHVARQVEALLGTYVPAWKETDPATGHATGLSGALVGTFARLCEILIQRLNQAPDKNQLAFLDLLGASPMPPQAARAPLTFALAAGATLAFVPARTQVAAPPPAGSKQPILFETEADLSLTPATLARLVTWDAASDQFADQGAAADPGNDTEFKLFAGTTPAGHMFALKLDSLLGFGSLSDLTVHVDLAQPVPAGADARSIQWEIWDGQTATPITPVAVETRPADSTNALTQSGDIYFAEIGIAPQSGWGTGRLLRARLTTPLNQGAAAIAGQVRTSQLPSIANVTLNGRGWCGPFLPDAAFAGTAAIDVSRDFYPFGSNPAYGSTFYIASGEVFSRSGRQINIYAAVTDPTASGIPLAVAQSTLRLDWEFWNGQAWTLLGQSGPGLTGSAQFSDNTGGFTQYASQVFIVLQEPSVPTVVNGIRNHWIRVRIAAGNYTPAPITTPGQPIAPFGPSLSNISVAYSNGNSYGTPQPVDAVIAYDGMHDDEVAFPFTAFAPAPEGGEALYLGFSLPAALPQFAQTPVSLHAEIVPVAFGTPADNAGTPGTPLLGWSYWNGTAWSTLGVADGTAALTMSGPLQFLPPADMVQRRLFGTDGLFWLRVTWISGTYIFLPRLRRLLLNTVMGEQAVMIRSEVLGSSNGTASQTFTAARAPVLAGVALDVIEPELPGAAEAASVIANEGSDAILRQADGTVRVRWHEVPDFYASGPRDRHYVLDHQSGAVLFGNGQSGLVPPPGAGNIVLTAYRTGGGDAGNVDAGAIKQLKTTLPYVDRVSNPSAASGGVGMESLDSLRARAPRAVRHGGRAVTADDFEDLARLASPEVARVRAVPLYDLTADPDGTTALPGTVSVIVVPQSDALRPSPAAELVDRVALELAANALPGLDLVVVGPEYLQVDVHAELVLARLDSAATVQAAALAALTQFLNPLTGGPAGTGWDFGRQPFRSDLTALLQGIAGVDHLRRLDLTLVPDRPGTVAAGRFLVCSGRHRIDLAFGV